MKKRFRMIIALLIALTLLIPIVNPEARAAGAGDFTVKNGVLTKYTGPGGDVVIPRDLGIREIGVLAFSDCLDLDSVVIPAGVTKIRSSAFFECGNLKKISMPQGITSLGNEAFSFCENLTSIALPETVTEIGSACFSFCYSLTSVSLSSGLRSIDTQAFFSCISLSTIDIPDSVTSVGYHAFYKSGIQKPIFSRDLHILYAVPSAYTQYNIPDTVTEISSGAFAGCDALISVSIPESVTQIGICAFEECERLTSVHLPDSVTEIGGGAFSACSRLKTVNIPEHIASVGTLAFASTAIKAPLLSPDQKTLYCVPCDYTNYIVPDTVININGGAFGSCAKLASVTIPDTVKTIGERAFQFCKSLKSINLPSNVKVGDAAFCSSGITAPLLSADQTTLYYVPVTFTSYTVPNTVKSINDGAFFMCLKLTSLELSDSITRIGKEAFRVCASLKTVTLPNSIETIGDGSFAGCSQLNNITIPNGVKSIGDSAFRDCAPLKSVSLPATLTSIGDNAFDGDVLLQSISLPSSVTSIGNDAFAFSPKLTIYGLNGSYAQRYAEENLIPFAETTFSDPAASNAATVTVNGVPVSFEAYTINGSNYFKLRDLAMALSGTGKRFSVGWDGPNNAISLTSGQVYAPIGGELSLSGNHNAVTAEMTASKVYLDGTQIYLSAYQIGGANYFRLRDIGKALDFSVTWDDRTKTISIDTSMAYA